MPRKYTKIRDNAVGECGFEIDIFNVQNYVFSHWGTLYDYSGDNITVQRKPYLWDDRDLLVRNCLFGTERTW